MKALQTLILFITLLCVSACKNVDTWSERTPAELPNAYANEPLPEATLTDSLLTLFDSEALETIVNQALANNPDLLSTQARMEEAGFGLKNARASLFPSIDANGAVGRSKTAGFPESSTYSASLDASWEVDVWGRVRDQVSASEADANAAIADYTSARQSLAAQVMQAWFTLVAAEKTLDLNERRVASFTKTEKSVNRRFEQGQATLGELELTRSDLYNSEADLQSSRDERDQAARQLRVLAGDYPDALLEADSWPKLERTVSAGLPSDLLLQRPDILAAYQRILAADARVDVAHADLFPSFILTGSLGRQSSQFSDLTRSGFDTWSLFANLSAPLWDNGRRRAELNAAGKRAEQAYYSYQSTVLNAFREVENALGSESYLMREESARNTALSSARRSFESSQRDYESGIIDLISLLEIQRIVFTTEQLTINIQASRLNNRVALALALGSSA